LRELLEASRHVVKLMLVHRIAFFQARARCSPTLVLPACEHKRPCGVLANVMRTGCLRGRNPVDSLTGIDARITVTTVRQISQ
jgi:hypothetical protein